MDVISRPGLLSTRILASLTLYSHAYEGELVRNYVREEALYSFKFGCCWLVFRLRAN